MRIMILYFREVLAYKFINLSIFFMPAKMKQVFSSHIYVAAKSYADIVKKECGE